MNKNILIKICGIQTMEMASVAAKAGANFVGMIFHPSSKRFVPDYIAKPICEAVEDCGAKMVGVFVDHLAYEMFDICELTGIKIVQLHGIFAKREAYKLPQHIQRIYVINVDYNGKILDAGDKQYIDQLDYKRDFLLFDGIQSGSGRAFDFNQFKCTYNVPFFLAGGLNINNVEKAIMVVQPDGVDVSSGVENIYGVKAPALIRQFILEAKKAEKKSG